VSRLVIEGLHVEVAGREVVRGVDLQVGAGEVHVIMGPNGSGKSSLAHSLAGHPRYRVVGGRATLDGVDLLEVAPADRARAGLFLALQHPLEVPGVRPREMLLAAGVDASGLEARLHEEAQRVGLREDLLDRFLNVDLSGGERKRAEVVQFAMLRRAIAIFDEVDSGLDVDALRAVARRISAATSEWGCGVLAITHFRRLLEELAPDVIHVMSEGRLVATGGPELSEVLERDGYEPFRAAH
jgi:Fe-S cluster assembly ATP-binding protein